MIKRYNMKNIEMFKTIKNVKANCKPAWTDVS